ncbi:MAG: glyceraldehyde-3-phosphate dehydrogenase [Flavobacteriales bacterium]|nr:glyceraldehyde-3-phosphate dehydrogenase [Flavobacteriales bacterium]
MPPEVANEKVKGIYEKELQYWIEREKKAAEVSSMVSDLWYDKSVELVMFMRPLVDQKISFILNLHDYATKELKKEGSIFTTAEVAKGIAELDLAPSKIDVGKLSLEWAAERADYNEDLAKFLNKKLESHIGIEKRKLEPRDVVLFGFGRIGRLLARELILQAGKGEQLRLRAIVTRSSSAEDIYKRASLLRTDSVHGRFTGTVTEDVENNCLIINGHRVHMIVGKPDEIDYTSFGIDNALLIDNTGAFRDREGLGNHLKANGISKVLLTAPGKGDIPNIVFGINQGMFDIDSETIFSAASCTTNAIVPVLNVLENELGIEKGHIETIHAFTNDQNLLDNYHKKYRRGRSAPLNMVITETGAGKAVVKAIPSLEGKLTANAVRVPTPNASLAILSLTVKKDTSVDDLNDIMRNAAMYGDSIEQIKYSASHELVSADIVGNNCPSVYDSRATIVSNDKKDIVLYVWYDNEYGYSRQVMHLSKYIAKVRRLTYY